MLPGIPPIFALQAASQLRALELQGCKMSPATGRRCFAAQLSHLPHTEKPLTRAGTVSELSFPRALKTSKAEDPSIAK